MTIQTQKDLSRKLARLLEFLAYTSNTGWLTADQFDTTRVHRFALTQARDLMRVMGAFCWFSGEGSSDISAPLVYIAVAADEAEAQSIHRKVWSQGIVPFLIVATPEQLILCHGFHYNGSRWRESITTLGWSDIEAPIGAATSNGDRTRWIRNLRSSRLRSSVSWRDYSVELSGRVDQVLLSGLTDLSDALIKGVGVSRRLPHTAANGLIGKLLYLYCLADRGVINQQWLASHGHNGIELANADVAWSPKCFWALLDDLDSIFNGSIFPVTDRDRAKIDDTHLGLARAVLKHGAKAFPNGAVQLSFLDVDFSVLRVETLSAVYEQFLENVENGERRRVGAYYTPPFLVDLVLNEVEEDMPLKDGTTVLDPAAGSGVFLVGAYRRILEHAWGSESSPLSLDRVRDLLIQNVFGVERNPDACHVTAFSLYLTMLDYVSPRDLSIVAAGQDPKKLFPCLLRKNLFASDFFSNEVQAGLPLVQCVVGNPPWQTLEKLRSKRAIEWADGHPDCPVGRGQAAELFVWKALRTHLASDGVLAMLIPSKSFVNPTSARFRSRLQSDAYVTGAINFSHLRHKLFAGAKHACAALFVRNRLASDNDRTWVYTPLSITQPSSSNDERPWTLMVDSAAIYRFRHEALATDPHGWFEAFMLSPVDRQIRQYMSDAAESGSILKLHALCESVGATYKRGGNASETGLPTNVLYGAESDNDSGSEATAPGQTGDLFGLSIDVSEPGRLPVKQLAKVSASYRSQFSGNILLVPRNFRRVRFVDYPMAFNSSHLAVFFDGKDGQITSAQKRFLYALGRYLRSGVALYFLSTTGRRWLMDRSNVEPADFGNLPIPFTSLDDERVAQILQLDDGEVNAFVLKAFKLDHDLRKAIDEFLYFRLGFQDGNVPDNALARVRASALKEYLSVLRRSLDGFVGMQGAFHAVHEEDPEGSVAVVVARYSDDTATSPSKELTAICNATLERNRQQRHNSFANSAPVEIDGDGVTFSIVKPLEYFRWTIDCAYADSRRVVDALLREAI